MKPLYPFLSLTLACCLGVSCQQDKPAAEVDSSPPETQPQNTTPKADKQREIKRNIESDDSPLSSEFETVQVSRDLLGPVSFQPTIRESGIEKPVFQPPKNPNPVKGILPIPEENE
ncbi:hypothetical protein SAMN02745181_0326 [Rubritalea squalenifaciens DSM 18772]|uniref:Uncharacterized protein n=1 Tax=Rubritalea squalenifaciens DSM 18772 TaxID=1123071 RepID=A0A1M6BW87_9BACT|nr:hypothetical protein [Rubritalea squalenifaciens]SHI53042.1 hypothetical protein SAMN02745181_0326 [Rubritalea squalenifaciens DSM 18772]